MGQVKPDSANEMHGELLKDWLYRVQNKLTANFTICRSWTVDEMGAFMEEIRDLASEFSRESVEAGIRNLMRQNRGDKNGFVTLADIQAAMPKRVGQESAADPTCKECAGTGFKYIGRATVKPCECRRRSA